MAACLSPRRYVDLNAFHPRWEALAKTPMEYGIFLQVLDKFHTVSTPSPNPTRTKLWSLPACCCSEVRRRSA
jgi:hypothetical protein